MRIHVVAAMETSTVVSAQQAGWASARTIGSFAVVAVLLAGFVAIEQRSRDPLVRLAISRSSALTRANLGALTLFGSSGRLSGRLSLAGRRR